MSKTVKTTADETDVTAVESFSGEDYVLTGEDLDFPLGSLKSADTFSVSATPEGIEVYGKEQKAPWSLAWSGVVVTSRLFKACSLIQCVL